MRERDRQPGGNVRYAGDGAGADAATFLAVAFPDDQVQILPYNRIVKDLGGLTPDAFLDEVRRRASTLVPGTGRPGPRGEFAMYFQGAWHTLRSHAARRRSPPTRSPRSMSACCRTSCSRPCLKIADVRTDTRIDFVGGARGTGELEQLVDSGRAAVAFSLFPGGVDDLMAVSDAGAIMPPKSTWFEPKLRDGLLIHLI